MPTIRRFPALALFILSVLLASAASAGVVLEQRVRIGGFGPHKVGASEATVVSKIQGDRARDESTLRFTGKFLGKITGDQAGVTITRLDRDVIWDLQREKGTYTELTFAEMKRQREDAMKQLEASAAKGQSGSGSSESSGYTWGPPEVRSERTGKKEPIAGISAEQAVITVTSIGKDTKTGETCEAVWTLDTWNGAETAASKEASGYHARLAAEMGFTRQEMDRAGPQLMAMLGAYGNGWQKVYDELSKLGGLSLRTTLGLSLGGPCAAAQGGPGSEGASTKPGGPTAVEPGGMLGAGKKVMGRLMKGRKSAEEPSETAPDQAPQAAAPRDGVSPIFSITTETTGIRQTEIPAAEFEVPAGAKRMPLEGQRAR